MPANKAFQVKIIDQIWEVNGISIIQDDCLRDLEITLTKSLIPTRITEHTYRDTEGKKESKSILISISFIHELNTNLSLELDEEKVKAIMEFPTPRDLHTKMFHRHGWISVKIWPYFDDKMWTFEHPSYSLNSITTAVLQRWL